jgi:hypothetical protein
MSLTNSQMIAGRFLRYARARQRVAWIKAQLAAGRIVQLTQLPDFTRQSPLIATR